MLNPKLPNNLITVDALIFFPQVNREFIEAIKRFASFLLAGVRYLMERTKYERDKIG